MVDPRRLLVFDAVVRAGSITGAAVELNFSAAAISQQVAALESEVGMRLLRRLPRGVAPTAAGRVAAHHARLVAEQVAAATAALGAEAREARDELTIMSFPLGSSQLLAPVLGRLRVREPRLRVTIQDVETSEAVARIRCAAADLALVLAPDVAHGAALDGLDACVVDRIAVAVMLPSTHPMARRQVVSLKDLVDDRAWIQAGDALCVATLIAHEAGGPAPRIVRRAKDLNATRALVAAGAGLALVHETPALEAASGAVVRPLSPSVELDIVAVLPVSARPVAIAVRDALLEARPDA